MWILIIGGLLLLVLFAWGAHQQNQGEIAKANHALAGVSGFNPAVTASTGWNKPSISIDPTSERFAVITPNQPPAVFRFCELIAVEVERDGRSVTKTNRGSQAAGAAVGAILLGPAGLLLGGLSGSKRQEEKIKRIVLKLYTSHLANPVVEVAFLSSWTGLDANSFGVKAALRQADEWYGRFRAILHGQEQARSVGLKHQLDAPKGHENATASVSPVDLRQAPLDEAAARQGSEERVQAIMARIEDGRLRRSNQTKLEPGH